MDNPINEAIEKLEESVYASLETYSNVHRGSGHYSLVTTNLFEKAREIVLEYLGLNRNKYRVIFCTPRRATILRAQLKTKSYQILSSSDFGLSLGVRALAVDRKSLPGGIPFETGGGNARLVSPGSVIWAGAPDRFEAGTPAVVNIIAFARALQLMRHFGIDSFRETNSGILTSMEILSRDLPEGSGRELLEELKKTLIGRNGLVPTGDGDRPYVNLDYAASTPTFMPVWNAMKQAWRQPEHVKQEIIQEVRRICAGVLDAPLSDYDVIFTSNTTEAINLAAESTGRSEQGIENIVLNTFLEHNSNELPWRVIPDLSLIRMQVDDEGFLDMNGLDSMLRAYNMENKHGKKRIRLVAISGASNVLGTFNDLAGIGRIVHKNGARLMVDAAQLVAHRKVEMERCGIDYLAFSAHKVYAPFGTGVLVVRKGLLHFNNTELETIQSSGEENAGGIAALGKALLILQRIGFCVIREEEQLLTAMALKGMSQIQGIRIYGIRDPGSPRFVCKGGVVAFSLGNIFPNKVASELALAGIGVRYGCHCAHLLIKRLLHVPSLLERFQRLLLTLFPKISLPGVVRVSLGIGNTKEDIETLVHALGNIARQRKSPINRDSSSGHDGPVTTKKEVQKQIRDFTRNAVQKVYSRL